MSAVVPLPWPPFEDGGTGKEGAILPALIPHLKGTSVAIQKTPGQCDTTLNFSFLLLCKTDFFFFFFFTKARVSYTCNFNPEFKYGISFVSLLFLFGSYFVQNVKRLIKRK